jgi:hypothetical protein
MKALASLFISCCLLVDWGAARKGGILLATSSGMYSGLLINQRGAIDDVFFV